MKKYCILLLFPLLILLLCSCSAEALKNEAELIWTEKSSIAEMIRFDPSKTGSTLSQASLPAVPDSEAPHHLICETHTELLTSMINSAGNISTAVSVGGNQLSEYPTRTDVPESEKAGYLVLPLFASHKRAVVETILSNFGITPEWIEQDNMAAAGDVFAIDYAGFSDENGYCINPDVPVTLYVSSEKKASVAQSGSNLVYLTFDDGPTSHDTERLLDILDSYGVRATFFTIGDSVKKYPDSAGAIVSRGHSLGCHSMTHVYTDLYASAYSLEQEVTAWENAVRSAGIPLGEHGKLFRFPGGSVGKYLTKEKLEPMEAVLADHGYSVFDWNIVTNDGLLYLVPEGESPYRYLMDNLLTTLDDALKENEGKEDAPLIVLMHEVTPETIDLMPWILETFISRGFTFGFLPDRAGSWTFADR